MIPPKTLAVFHKVFLAFCQRLSADKNRKGYFQNFSGKKYEGFYFWVCFRNTVAKRLRLVENPREVIHKIGV
jgi:hypothetical protein